jgi:hypothetical protein
VFSKDWQENVIGQLKPGTSFEVVYDSNRLPEIRDTYNGLPAWSILGFESHIGNYRKLLL